MSKHIFTDTIDAQQYEIQIGWDKPTQEYYGLILGFIEDTDCEDGGYFDDLIWSNIFSPGKPLALEEIASEITGRGFTIPEGLLDNVRSDMLRNAVNEHRFYDDPPQINNADNDSLPLFQPQVM